MGPPPIGGYVGRLLRLCINGLFAYRYFVELRRKMRPEIARWFVTINPEKKDDGAAISVDLAFVTLPAFCKISSYTFYISSLPETRDFTAMTALLCWSGLYSNVFTCSFGCTRLPETRDFTAMTALLCWSGLYSNVFTCSFGCTRLPGCSVSASEMTYIVSSGALNSTHSLTHFSNFV